MDFADHQEETKKAGLGSNFFTCEKGENKFRALSFPEQIGTHYFEKVVGVETPKPVNCTMSDDCVYCAKKMKVSIQVQMYILDRKDETIKLGKFAWTVFTAIGEKQQSSEYGFPKGTLPPYDLIVTKSGEGQFGTKYEVDAGRNSDLITDDQKAELAEKKPVAELVAERVQKARDEQNAHSVAAFGDELKVDPNNPRPHPLMGDKRPLPPKAEAPLPTTPFN